MRVRLRGPAGASTVNLSEDATVGDLRAEIREKTSLAKFDIKYGYPPKPLILDQDSTLLSALNVKLNGEQLTIIAQESDHKATTSKPLPKDKPVEQSSKHAGADNAGFSFAGMNDASLPTDTATQTKSTKPIPLKKKPMAEDVPEIPLPDRGATLVMRVMPDDNSCLFRAFGTAVVPGDDLSMTELRSLVAAAVQSDPETYSKVVLEQEPDNYCRWIQTEEAWGGSIELNILANHFDLEICSIDVQSSRVDRYNEGKATRCILVYSGIHYDTIVISPSDPPYTKSHSPPDFDTRIFDSDDDVILFAAVELCKKLKDKHYFTDTGGMAILCETCKWVGYGEAQAQTHAEQTGHYDMKEVQTAK